MSADYRAIEDEIAHCSDPDERARLIDALADLRALDSDSNLRNVRWAADEKSFRFKLLALRIFFVVPVALSVYWPIHVALSDDYFSLRGGTQIYWDHDPGMFLILGTGAAVLAVSACLFGYMLLSSELLLRRLRR